MTTKVDLAVPLRIADLRAARDPITIVVGPHLRDRVAAGRTFLSEVLGDDRAVYGATTGFGALVGYAGRVDLRDQADNTLAHLGAGQGPELDAEVVRATLLLRAGSLARGASGCPRTSSTRWRRCWRPPSCPRCPGWVRSGPAVT